MKPGWWKLLPEQILNSVTVAGIAAFSTMAGEQRISVRVTAIAFGVTFLAELRKWLDRDRAS